MDFKRRAVAILFCSLSSIACSSEVLVFAIDIIRHGDRTPITPIPTVPYEWKEGLGQLTALGMVQEYQLGVALRKKYIEESQLLPEHYAHGTMYVRSTDYERTLMSAQSLLTGLYPPGTGPSTLENPPTSLPYSIQPIPVFSAPAESDTVINKTVSSQERADLMQRYVYPTKEWQDMDNQLKPKYPLWSQLTGLSIKKLDDIETLGNTLYIHQLHQAPMPDGLSSEDINTIIKARNRVFIARERPTEIGKAFTSQLMTNVVKYLNGGIQQNSSLKYVLLSAHDTTITRLLSLLEAPLTNAPPYAANLNFSLYKSDANQYLIRVSYNGTPVSIPACGGVVCTLEQLQTRV